MILGLLAGDTKAKSGAIVANKITGRASKPAANAVGGNGRGGALIKPKTTRIPTATVSYTHLTLPTKRIV